MNIFSCNFRYHSKTQLNGNYQNCQNGIIINNNFIWPFFISFESAFAQYQKRSNLRLKAFNSIIFGAIRTTMINTSTWKIFWRKWVFAPVVRNRFFTQIWKRESVSSCSASFQENSRNFQNYFPSRSIDHCGSNDTKIT